MKPIILASTSLSRQKILKKFNIPFEIMAPDCDETPYQNESPIALVLRLSKTKAFSIVNKFPDIGLPLIELNRILIELNQNPLLYPNSS